MPVKVEEIVVKNDPFIETTEPLRENEDFSVALITVPKQVLYSLDNRNSVAWSYFVEYLSGMQYDVIDSKGHNESVSFLCLKRGEIQNA